MYLEYAYLFFQLILHITYDHIHRKKLFGTILDWFRLEYLGKLNKQDNTKRDKSGLSAAMHQPDKSKFMTLA